MRKSLWCCGVVVLCLVADVRAEPTPAVKVVKETWDAAYLEGVKCGYFHTTIQEIDRDGQKILRGTLSMSLSIKRYDEIVSLRMETSTDETPEGKVVGMSMTQFLDKEKKLVQTGKVEGESLLVRTPTDPTGRKVPWDDKVIGLARQETLYKDKKVKPGDKLEYLSFEPGLLATVRVKAVVKPAEEVDLLTESVKSGNTIRVERVRKSLMRVEAQSDKVKVEGNLMQLPGLVLWLDKDSTVVRSEMYLPGLGQLTLYRTTRAVAEQEGVAPAQLPDLGRTTMIALDHTIPNVHSAKAVVYRITVKDDDDAATSFVQDSRQTVKPLKDGSFELRVQAVRAPVVVEKPGDVKKEYLSSSYFLDSDDDKVQALAQEAVGRETDPWRKAQKIEKYVHDNMKASSKIGFACASQIANDKQGDCRQHAMLTAAMCRAAGVPSRTALGLVYVPNGDKAELGFHMWTEVWIKGQWLGIDATLGQGGVGPGHLKISDHSWHDTQTLAPLLPVTRVMGKLKVEVVKVERDE